MKQETKDTLETYEPYIIGEVYKGKGKYLGKATPFGDSAVHKFERHSHSFTFARAKNFGPKYFFEKA